MRQETLDLIAMLEVYTDPRRRVEQCTHGQALAAISAARAALKAPCACSYCAVARRPIIQNSWKKEGSNV